MADAAGGGIDTCMAKPVLREAIPLYHQIFLALRDEILSGARPFGAAMPTEQELGAIHGVSRITASRALDELAEHGLVERRRRIGTRVSFRAPAALIEGNIDQALESLIAFGRGTRVRVVELDEVPATMPVAGALAIDVGAPVLRALRIRIAASVPPGAAEELVPLGAIESFVPAHLGLALTRGSLTETPILELIRRAGHDIGAGRQTILAMPADPALAAMLGTEARAAIIRIDRIVCDRTGRPLLFTIARYRGDRYRLSLDFHGDAQSTLASAASRSE